MSTASKPQLLDMVEVIVRRLVDMGRRGLHLETRVVHRAVNAAAPASRVHRLNGSCLRGRHRGGRGRDQMCLGKAIELGVLGPLLRLLLHDPVEFPVYGPAFGLHQPLEHYHLTKVKN